jgi:hypothetical protein
MDRKICRKSLNDSITEKKPTWFKFLDLEMMLIIDTKALGKKIYV